MTILHASSFSVLMLLTSMLMDAGPASGQNAADTGIRGYVKMDDTWEPALYLSYVPTFDDMYIMSHEMIIARARVDSLGYFEFDVSFLPVEESLFRLHIAKKGETPASLIIGGNDENHLFFIANRHSNFELRAASFHPPFKNVTFKNSDRNVAFQRISDLVHRADSAASESTGAKRKLIEDKLYKDLTAIADTTENLLVSLYAIYKGSFRSNRASQLELHETYLKKWSDQGSPYFKYFNKQAATDSTSHILISSILTACIFIAIGFFLGRYRPQATKNLEKLSIQERKILELLKQGATNQEISNQYHIEVSTVKSHVSSILSKLNMKSRKEIIDLK